MKKILLATTALIAAGAFAAPAHAELEVTVGGYTAFQAAAFNSSNSNESGRDFQAESQIIISADATADNGLQYGAYIEMEASSDDTQNIDEANLYLAGAFGRVEMGDQDGASEMAIFAPTVGIGQINGSYDDFMPSFARAGDLNDRGGHNFILVDTYDSTKITYYTPKISGFQAGISYAPEFQGGETVQFTKGVTFSSDTVEMGLTYEGELAGLQVKAGGIYIVGDANGAENINEWSLGTQVAYQGFTFGGSYSVNGESMQDENLANDSVSSWTIGATYEQGPWGVGLSYVGVDFDENGDSFYGVTGGEYKAAVLGGTYKLAPGLTAGVDFALYDRDANGTADDYEGYVLMTDVTAAF